jgi:hypothetical protein
MPAGPLCRPHLDGDHGRQPALRLWFPSFAYVLLSALRRIALAGTELAQATCGTIRLKLLKLGARVTASVRRIKIAITQDRHHFGLPAPGRIRSRPCPAARGTRLSLGSDDCPGTARATCVRNDSP